jgi:hypothetical protein
MLSVILIIANLISNPALAVTKFYKNVIVSLEVGEADTGLFERVADLETVGVGVSEGS